MAWLHDRQPVILRDAAALAAEMAKLDGQVRAWGPAAQAMWSVWGVVQAREFVEGQDGEPEFDYLKSLEIEEKINKIKWCRRQNAAHFLLSTNGEALALFTLQSGNSIPLR